MRLGETAVVTLTVINPAALTENLPAAVADAYLALKAAGRL